MKDDLVQPSWYWTGTEHKVRYVCVYCGRYWHKPKKLRLHLERHHGSIHSDPTDDAA